MLPAAVYTVGNDHGQPKEHGHAGYSGENHDQSEAMRRPPVHSGDANPRDGCTGPFRGGAHSRTDPARDARSRNGRSQGEPSLCRSEARPPCFGRVTIWVDAQLPPAIAAWITVTHGVTAVAVRDIGLRDADDADIF